MKLRLTHAVIDEGNFNLVCIGKGRREGWGEKGSTRKLIGKGDCEMKAYKIIAYIYSLISTGRRDSQRDAGRFERGSEIWAPRDGRQRSEQHH